MPYWRLSFLYFFYFAALGVWLPYSALYFVKLGFSAIQIGYLAAIMAATKIVAPNLWGWLADRSTSRMLIVRMGTLGTCVGFAAMFFNKSYLGIAVVTFLFNFFWNAVLAQFEAVTLLHLGARSQDYSRIRLWGSIGFIVAVVGVGWYLQGGQADNLVPIVAALFAALFVSSLTVPEPARHLANSRASGLLSYLLKPSVPAFFIAAALMQFSHGAYYTYYTLYLADFGVSSSVIGILWALGVLAEVGMFMIMPRLMQCWGVKALLVWALAAALVRWLLIAAFPEIWSILLAAQLLHAATFAIFHSASIEFMRQTFEPPVQGRGQAFYSASSFGLGGALGAYCSGFLWAWHTSAAFYLAAFAGLVGLVLVVYRVRPVNLEVHTP